MGEKMKQDRYYRNMYKDAFTDYLVKRLGDERKKEGEGPYSDSTIKTIVSDAFFLEKNCTTDFMYWFRNKDTMDEALKQLNEILRARGREEDNGTRRQGYFWDMCVLRDFLETTGEIKTD